MYKGTYITDDGFTFYKIPKYYCHNLGQCNSTKVGILIRSHYIKGSSRQPGMQASCILLHFKTASLVHP